MNKLLSCCLGVLLLFAADAASAQSPLRWEFKPGQKLAITITQDTAVETVINADPQRATFNMIMDLAWEVADVDDQGAATMTQAITRLKVTTIAAGAEPVTYDSQSPDRPTGAAAAIAASLKPLVGAKFTVKMDARGTVSEVKLTPETEKALEALPADSPLKSLLTPSGLTELLRASGGPLPAQAIQPGEKWQADLETPTPYGKLLEKVTYTYKGPISADSPIHQVTLESIGRLQAKPDAAIKLDTKEQTKTGEINFDASAGLLRDATTRLTSTSVRALRTALVHVKVTSETKTAVRAE